MKALSVKYPWSSAILHAGKDVENRGWETRFRGRVLIHTGKQPDNQVLNHPRWSNWLLRKGALAPNWPMGAIAGTVEVYDCQPGDMCQLEWANGSEWAWLLREPRIFREPVPYRGALGLFDVPDDVVAEALASELDPVAYHQWARAQRTDRVLDPRVDGRLD